MRMCPHACMHAFAQSSGACGMRIAGVDAEERELRGLSSRIAHTMWTCQARRCLCSSDWRPFPYKEI